ncbi:hypothetical protein NQ314_011151 [Rhamnusium bicolor]|uniref:Alpha-1,3-glucosyltransferase n=1 Tax=Rhamnusium bicolor TaxID=1586634 RepID=A0AAV8XL80_9CUCU|nr:hypothetical protein NQ314_011151 [Rhamnusium bicolor]
MNCKISCETWLVIFGTLLAILLRCCTSLHPYSGEATPPMYGDYEAQRHWMEVTTNLPTNQWYVNTSDNDLNYWGLDYPPMTAYHMYLCGRAANLINENFTKLHDSRGYESDTHKVFMRYTVLIGDVFLFIPAIILYYQTTVKIGKTQDNEIKKKKQKSSKTLNEIKPMNASLSIVLALLYPGIILIDHGHFQYNCISLAFAIFATTLRVYLSLGKVLFWGILRLMKIGTTVIVMFMIIWYPFTFDLDDFELVLLRQFPIARGVFEDKVANIWCALNVVFKFKTTLDNYQMMRICLFTTLSALFPSSVDLFLRPNLRKFVLSLINSSLAFFLFSFQVHEKTILLVAIPVLIISIEHAYRSSLNTQDGLAEYYRSLLATLLDIEYKKATQLDILKMTYQQVIKNSDALKTLIFHFAIPPTRYPDLYPLLISVYACVHFVGFFVYFNVKQLRIPQQFEDIKNVKVKSS